MVEEAGLLRNLPAALEQRDLPLDLELDRLADEAEGVDVLQLDAGAEAGSAALAHADVRVAAERALLHVSVVHPEVDEGEPQRLEVLARILGGAQLRVPDDLDERHARAVEVDVRSVLGVDVLARVFLEVDAGEPDLADRSVGLRHGHRAADADGQFELRHLKALGQVGIEVVLAHRAAIERRKRAGKTEAHRAHLGIGRCSEGRRAAAEDLAPGEELGVDLEADHRLPVSERAQRGSSRGGKAMARSAARAMRKSVASSKGLPMSCSPMGSPALEKPQGSEIPGRPARFAGTV